MRHQVMVVDAAKREREIAAARAATSMSTSVGFERQGHRPRLDRAFLLSREHLAGRQHEHVLQDRLGSKLVLLVGVVPDHVDVMARAG